MASLVIQETIPEFRKVEESTKAFYNRTRISNSENRINKIRVGDEFANGSNNIDIRLSLLEIIGNGTSVTS